MKDIHIQKVLKRFQMPKHLGAIKFSQIRTEFFANTQVHRDEADDGCLADTALSVLKTLPQQNTMRLQTLGWNSSFDLISIIYANSQNSLCNSVAPCPHIIHTKVRQNQTQNDREEII